MRNHSVFRAVALVAAACAPCGCDEEDFFDEIEEARDCKDACADWAACVGGDFDALVCEQRCETAVDAGLLANDRVEACEACLDRADGRCVEGCGAVCEGVVFDIPLPERAAEVEEDDEDDDGPCAR